NGLPTITSFTPSEEKAGAFVVLTGTNFVNVSSVKFNGADSFFTVDSSSQITATVPALATSGTISVTTPFGTGNSPTPFVILQPPVMISQIYGGAGNVGATFNRDYVELYNRSGSGQSLGGWTLQYAAANGTSWEVIQLTGTIGAGK